jgi:hypothetical protein
VSVHALISETNEVAYRKDYNSFAAAREGTLREFQQRQRSTQNVGMQGLLPFCNYFFQLFDLKTIGEVFPVLN